MTTETKPTLLQKLVEVMGAIDAVEKHGTNDKQGYKYVKATDVAREVRAELVKRGILMLTDIESERTWDKQTNAGGTLLFVSLRIGFTFHDAETGQTIGPVHAYGWGMDSGDKAVYKATTGALKYALRSTFLIPDESDPENEAQDAPTKRKTATARPVQPTAQPDIQACNDCGKDTPVTKGPICATCKAKKAIAAVPTPIKVEPLRDDAEVITIRVRLTMDNKKKDGTPYRHISWLGPQGPIEASCFDAKYFDLLDGKLGSIVGEQMKMRVKYSKGYINVQEILEVSGLPFAEYASQLA